MRRLLLGAALVVVALAGITLTGGTTGRVETAKRTDEIPAARPADADQLWAANPSDAEADADPDDGELAAEPQRRAELATSRAATGSEAVMASDGSTLDEPADAAGGSAVTSADGPSSGPSEGGADEANATDASSEDATPDSSGDGDGDAADPDDPAATTDTQASDAEGADGDDSAEDESASALGVSSDENDDAGDDDTDDGASNEPGVASATTSSTSSTTSTTEQPRTTTTRPAATTTTKKPATRVVDDPTAALASAIHNESAPTTIAPARTESKTQPFLTVYGPDGLPQLQPLPTDPYAPTPDIRLGKIRIPAIGLDHSLHQGMTLTALDRGPSQWPGSAMPGQVGNMVIGGHRTTRSRPFRNLDDLNKGDEVIVTDDEGVDHTYEVVVVEIVTPDAVHIATQTPDATATLFACHPPGSARQRIVVKLALA